MQTCCASCKKNTANIKSSLKRPVQNKLMFLSNCAISKIKFKTIVPFEL